MATQKSSSKSTSPVSTPADSEVTTPQGAQAAEPGRAEEETSNPEEPIESSTYPTAKLLRLWSRGEYTTEQMVGHLLQHVDALENRVYRLEHPTGALPVPVRPARK